MRQPRCHGLLQSEGCHYTLKIYFVLYYDFLIQIDRIDLTLLHIDGAEVILSVIVKFVVDLGLLVYLGARKFFKQPYPSGAPTVMYDYLCLPSSRLLGGIFE